MIRKWEELPDWMQCPEVKVYYDNLVTKTLSLVLKRIFDVVFAILILLLTLVPMIIIAVIIKCESKGPVFYRQERVTAYGLVFRIHKFRTMVNDAERLGSAVTVGNDGRITKVGKMIRGLRIDEIPQVIDVLQGNMSFVGTRPEATKYVKEYTKEMRATLLMPAGITSEASIRFKNEATLLTGEENIDEAYVKKILPQKMRYNLESIKKFSFWNDLLTLLRTVAAVLGKEY